MQQILFIESYYQITNEKHYYKNVNKSKKLSIVSLQNNFKL